jgi:hypothetical protein
LKGLRLNDGRIHAILSPITRLPNLSSRLWKTKTIKAQAGALPFFRASVMNKVG